MQLQRCLCDGIAGVSVIVVGVFFGRKIMSSTVLLVSRRCVKCKKLAELGLTESRDTPASVLAEFSTRSRFKTFFNIVNQSLRVAIYS
jgi:hypothetical protein